MGDRKAISWVELLSFVQFSNSLCRLAPCAEHLSVNLAGTGPKASRLGMGLIQTVVLC